MKLAPRGRIAGCHVGRIECGAHKNGAEHNARCRCGIHHGSGLSARCGAIEHGLEMVLGGFEDAGPQDLGELLVVGGLTAQDQQRLTHTTGEDALLVAEQCADVFM